MSEKSSHDTGETHWTENTRNVSLKNSQPPPPPLMRWELRHPKT